MRGLKELERVTFFAPAFDKRHPNPSKNYGIHSVMCRMVLKGKNGATHFVFSTGIYLPETMQEYAREGRLDPTKSEFSDEYFLLTKPMGYDIGYHSFTPRYDGQEISNSNCEWINAPCYCDGSALRAEEVLDVLIRKGSEDVWKILEENYQELTTPKSK